MTAPGDRPLRRARLLWLAVGAGGLLIWLLLAHLPRGGDSGLVVCLFRRATGISCPGCGLTRAFVAMASGDAGAAFALHPLAPLLLAELLLAWGVWGLRLRRFARHSIAPVVARLAVVNAAALLGIWVVRLWSGTLPD